MKRKSRYSGSLGGQEIRDINHKSYTEFMLFLSQHRFLPNNIIKLKVKSEIDLTCILKALVNIWTLP